MQNKTIGIYLITERATGRDVYVGQGIVFDRWKAHRSKYPEELFDYRILLECPRTDLNHWEQHYIRVLKTHWSEGGNNQTWGGQFWPRPEEPLSPATKKKMSESVKASLANEETKRKKSEAAKAYEASLSPEEKQKRSEAFRAAVTEEKKQKLSESAKAHEASLSAEEKQKRSETAKARKASLSPEEKQKWSEALRAAVTEEKKQKLSEAAKAQHARNRVAKAAAVAALEALLVY